MWNHYFGSGPKNDRLRVLIRFPNIYNEEGPSRQHNNQFNFLKEAVVRHWFAIFFSTLLCDCRIQGIARILQFARRTVSALER